MKTHVLLRGGHEVILQGVALSQVEEALSDYRVSEGTEPLLRLTAQIAVDPVAVVAAREVDGDG